MTVGMWGRGPKYLRIAEALRAQIRAGEFAPGTQLPAETALTEQFGVSLPTLRQAIGVLRSEGLVESRHGIGTFVSNTHRQQRRSRNRYGRARADEELLTADLIHEIVFAGRTQAPTHIAEVMNVADDQDVVVRQRHLSDPNTKQLEEIGASYLPLNIAAGTFLEEPTIVPKALFLCVEDLSQKQYAHARDSWISRFPSNEESDLFNLSSGMHVLHLIHTARADDGTILEVSESIWPADRIMVIDEYDIDQHAIAPDAHSDI